MLFLPKCYPLDAKFHPNQHFMNRSIKGHLHEKKSTATFFAHISADLLGCLLLVKKHEFLHIKTISNKYFWGQISGTSNANFGMKNYKRLKKPLIMLFLAPNQFWTLPIKNTPIFLKNYPQNRFLAIQRPILFFFESRRI